jgi:hypothetical protein
MLMMMMIVSLVCCVVDLRAQFMMSWADFMQQWEVQFPAWPATYSQHLQEVLGMSSHRRAVLAAIARAAKLRSISLFGGTDFSCSGFVSAYQFGQFVQGFGPFSALATNVRIRPRGLLTPNLRGTSANVLVDEHAHVDDMYARAVRRGGKAAVRLLFLFARWCGAFKCA